MPCLALVKINRLDEIFKQTSYLYAELTNCGSVWSSVEEDPFRTFTTVKKRIKSLFTAPTSSICMSWFFYVLFWRSLKFDLIFAKSHTEPEKPFFFLFLFFGRGARHRCVCAFWFCISVFFCYITMSWLRVCVPQWLVRCLSCRSPTSAERCCR